MYADGHRGVSLLVFAPILFVFLYYGEAALGFMGLFIVAVLLSSFPDIDLKIRWIPHRGPTHTIWFATLVGLVFAPLFYFIPSQFTELSKPLLMGVGFLFGFLGVVGHLVGDVITPTGIKPLWPLGKRYRIKITTAKGVWWFESVSSGNQQDMTMFETIRHEILNSNRVFLLLGLFVTGLTIVFSQKV